MRTFRTELHTIGEMASGVAPKDIRDSFRKISPESKNFREAIRIWAESLGVKHRSFNLDIIRIAYALGADKIYGWRDALRYIAENFGSPHFAALQGSAYLAMNDETGRLVRILEEPNGDIRLVDSVRVEVFQRFLAAFDGTIPDDGQNRVARNSSWEGI